MFFLNRTENKYTVTLLNYYSNHCTYIKFVKFTHLNFKNAPTCFGLKTILRELVLGPKHLGAFLMF